MLGNILIFIVYSVIILQVLITLYVISLFIFDLITGLFTEHDVDESGKDRKI